MAPFDTRLEDRREPFAVIMGNGGVISVLREDQSHEFHMFVPALAHSLLLCTRKPLFMEQREGFDIRKERRPVCTTDSSYLVIKL